MRADDRFSLGDDGQRIVGSGAGRADGLRRAGQKVGMFRGKCPFEPDFVHRTNVADMGEVSKGS